MRSRVLIAGTMMVLAGGMLYASKKHSAWLEKSYTSWDQKQVAQLFNQSAWAQTKSFRGQVQGQHGTRTDMGAGAASTGAIGTAGAGVGTTQASDGSSAPLGGIANGTASTGGISTGSATEGVDVPNFSFTARFFSAQPIREAYVRMLQIMNHYDTLPADRQHAFDQQVADRILHFDVSKNVIVMLSFHTNDPNAQRDMNQWFATQTTDTLKQNAYLYVPKAGQIQLVNYIPPQQGGAVLGAQFIFPRNFNGEPILEPGATGKVRFQLSYQPQVNQEMYIDFKPEDMTYKGQLSY